MSLYLKQSKQKVSYFEVMCSVQRAHGVTKLVCFDHWVGIITLVPKPRPYTKYLRTCFVLYLDHCFP